VLRDTFEAIPLTEVALVARGVPELHLPRLLQLLAAEVASSVHLGFVLTWVGALLREHHAHILLSPATCLVSLRAVQKGVQAHYDDLSKLCANNTHMLDFLAGSAPDADM
jgi:periodic tryptophan protein 2